MNTKWTKLLVTGLALGALSGTAAASGHVSVGFYLGAPAPVVAPPVVYTPPPVYYTPAPRVVYPTAPVYYPAPYYPAPYYATPAWGVRYGWGHGYAPRHWH